MQDRRRSPREPLRCMSPPQETFDTLDFDGSSSACYANSASPKPVQRFPRRPYLRQCTWSPCRDVHFGVEFANQAGRQFRAGASQRMTQRDGPAIRIHARCIQICLLNYG